jgi:hypothetical protein
MHHSARRARHFLAGLTFIAAAGAAGTVQAQALQHNPFDDPFVAVTSGVPNCPVPQEPMFTDEQYKAEAHDRAQRGVSCWMAGRCRLHSAYLYDKEIIPRVKQAITVAGRFANTSVWALGQRRYVWLKGCVATAEQSAELERLVRTIDDVDGVQNELMVGSQGQPPYATR